MGHVRFTKIIIFAMLIVCCLFVQKISYSYAQSDIDNATEEGVFYYREGVGIEVNYAGWYEIEEKYYYLKPDGSREDKDAGWYEIEEKYCYLESDGSREDKDAGWYEIAGKYYYLESDGSREDKDAGWYKIAGKYYYLKSDGSRVKKEKGWQLIGGKYYYLKSDGSRINKKGWQLIGEKYCYLKEDGNRQVKEAGFYKITGKWHYLEENGKFYSGWHTIGDNKYYFNQRGGITTGWIKVGGNRYYQTKKKGVAKNQIIEDKEKGTCYYVDNDGKLVNSPLMKMMMKIYKSETKSGMTREEKLYALYMYLATPKQHNTHFTYERTYDDGNYIGKKGWTEDFAYQLLSRKKGNCYRFACAFAYFAKILGYDSYVRVGMVTARGGGYTPHGWVEIRMGKNTYIYDPELQFAIGYDLYKQTYDKHKLSLKKGELYKIKF